MLLSSLSLSHFKNHTDFAVALAQKTLFYGENGSGKTNVLEAAYIACNGILPFGKKADAFVANNETTAMITGKIEQYGLDTEYRVGIFTEPNRIKRFCSGENVSQSMYTQTMPLQAVFFTPDEMNVLYLDPSLRRDFLDETATLAHSTFTKTKTEYKRAVTQRNKMLKNIRDGKAQAKDLDIWDDTFIRCAKSFYAVRLPFIAYVQERQNVFAELLEKKYRVVFTYTSKTNLDYIEKSLRDYLHTNRERDIIV